MSLVFLVISAIRDIRTPLEGVFISAVIRVDGQAPSGRWDFCLRHILIVRMTIWWTGTVFCVLKVRHL